MILSDLARFKDIVKRRIKKEFDKYIFNENLIKGKVVIPIKQIRLPTFRFGAELDQLLGFYGPGDAPGEHYTEIEFEPEELADILGEQLQLPRIKPKGLEQELSPEKRYSNIARCGPRALRATRRTLRQALRRSIIYGSYDPDNPILIPEKEDARYKYWKFKPIPKSKAVIFYILDVSGSMAEEQLQLSKTFAFWTDLWIRRNYKSAVIRYIQHDARAWETTRENFYVTREAGGTLISSGLKLLESIIEKEYGQDWNIYSFQFSDGDNWSEEDNQRCIGLLERLLQRLNLFCYCKIKAAFGEGSYREALQKAFSNKEEIVIVNIEQQSDLIPAIKAALGKGR